MNKYIVNHSGTSRSAKDDEVYRYKMGEPVALPDDVAKALGENAKKVGSVDETEEKDVKMAPINKMVGNKQSETK